METDKLKEVLLEYVQDCVTCHGQGYIYDMTGHSQNCPTCKAARLALNIDLEINE